MIPQDVYDLVQEALASPFPGGFLIENVTVDELDDPFLMHRRLTGAKYVTATTGAIKAKWFIPAKGPTTLMSYSRDFFAV